MKNKIKSGLILLLSYFAFSCSEKKIKKESDLIFFESFYLGEYGDDNYDELEKQMNEKPQVNYIDRYIFISKKLTVNACGEYTGEVFKKKDSLILVLKLTSQEVCASTVVDEVNYIVKNMGKKKYKIGFKYE